MKTILLVLLFVGIAVSGRAQAPSSAPQPLTGPPGISMTWTVPQMTGEQRIEDVTFRFSGVVLTAEEVIVTPSMFKRGEPLLELRGRVQLSGVPAAVQSLCASMPQAQACR